MLESTVSSPVAGVDYPRTFLEFTDWFSTDERCLDFLAKLPSGNPPTARSAPLGSGHRQSTSCDRTSHHERGALRPGQLMASPIGGVSRLTVRL